MAAIRECDWRLMPVVYVAGPFRPVRVGNEWEQQENIREAEAIALDIWLAGGAAICPHKNTEHFTGMLRDEVYLQGDLAILKGCDGVLFSPRWRESRGAVVERHFAVAHGIVVLDALSELEAFVGEFRRGVVGEK